MSAGPGVVAAGGASHESERGGASFDSRQDARSNGGTDAATFFDLNSVYLILTRKAAESVRNNTGRTDMAEAELRACVMAAIREAELPEVRARRDVLGTVLRASWRGLLLMGQRWDCEINVTAQPAPDGVKVVAFFWKCVPHTHTGV